MILKISTDRDHLYWKRGSSRRPGTTFHVSTRWGRSKHAHHDCRWSWVVL